MNKLIGLIGEDPNDTSSIKNLLSQKFSKDVAYTTLIRNVRGHQLDNARTKNALKVEFESKKPDIVVFIRDADGLHTHKEKIEKCNSWYQKLSEVVGRKKILLLNIWELEALIFADINTFNYIYKTNIKGNRDVKYIQDPKRELKHYTHHLQKKYSESDCPELFKKLNIETIIGNCDYFRQFTLDLSVFIKNK